MRRDVEFVVQAVIEVQMLRDALVHDGHRRVRRDRRVMIHFPRGRVLHHPAVIGDDWVL